MQENESITAIVYAIRSDVQLISHQLKSLADDIDSLKASTKVDEEETKKKFAQILTDYTRLETQFGIARLIITGLTLSILAIVGTRLWTVMTIDFSTYNQTRHQVK